MVLLFLCVLAHEFGHIFAARAFGVNTPAVTLLPIGGVAQLERIPEKPSQEFLVAIAGPLVNVAIAVVSGRVLRRDARAQAISPRGQAAVSMIDRLAAVNLFLVAFNLIPAFPMDGGRVLRALLASRLGYVRATEIAASIGQVVAFGLGFLGLFGNPLLIFIAIFVYLAASSEAQLVAIRAMSRDVPVSAAMMTQFARLAPEAHIDEAVDTLLRTSQSEFPVVDGGHLVGVLGRADLIRALKQLGPDASRRRHDQGHADGRPPRAASKRRSACCRRSGARGRRGGCRRQARRPDHRGDHRRDADGARGAARRRPRRPVEPAGGSVTARGTEQGPTCSPSIATREFISARRITQWS